MFDAIIFDFDGILLESEPLHFDACNIVFKPLGFELTWKEFQENFIGIPDKEMFPKVFHYKNRYFSPEETQALINQKIKYYTDIILCDDQLPMVKGVERYIKAQAKLGIKMAICSGSTRHEINTVLARFNNGELLDYFKIIISAEDVQKGKPSPEGYLLTAAQLNVSPDKCLVFEDGRAGITAAKAAGMSVIALPTTLPKSLLSQADKIIESFIELL